MILYHMSETVCQFSMHRSVYAPWPPDRCRFIDFMKVCLVIIQVSTSTVYLRHKAWRNVLKDNGSTGLHCVPFKSISMCIVHFPLIFRLPNIPHQESPPYPVTIVGYYCTDNGKRRNIHPDRTFITLIIWSKMKKKILRRTIWTKVKNRK